MWRKLASLSLHNSHAEYEKSFETETMISKELFIKSVKDLNKTITEDKKLMKFLNKRNFELNQLVINSGDNGFVQVVAWASNLGNKGIYVVYVNVDHTFQPIFSEMIERSAMKHFSAIR
ncbi:hypothetical protein SAMN05877753_105217 [Bacillus oleivorans]|uniref:Uncharacterized protein n=1 Tax=Bacillus oleivorans TaxID=1448271 RepID=A0A285CV96_9BACI|nr:hypothetical protein [Bacillus oleivorans]SNX71454.1 hypothetical protein SAMN05877753_105217 [Bacillus oleivorans]